MRVERISEDMDDLHAYRKRYEIAIRLLKNSNISERNKEIIEKFCNDCFAQGITAGRVQKYAFILRRVAEWLGKDFVNNQGEPYDDNGHGTHVAGIIAGDKTGVAPGASLIGVKVFNEYGSANASTIIEGFQWAAENNADVISYSGGALPIEFHYNSTLLSANKTITYNISVKPYLNEEAYKPAFIFLALWSEDLNNISVTMTNPDGETVDGIKADWFSFPCNNFVAYKYYNDSSPLQSGNWTLKLSSLKESDNNLWYSGSGNNLDNTLSINLSLKNVANATLRFYTYYDIEENFDYGYVEVIYNGTVYTLAEYTGYSDPHVETINLTQFAGENITLVFRYVTDSSVIYPGWWIDNIEIPEIEFYDDVEKGNIGWNAKGWSIVEESIPLYWEALVVYPSDGTSILDNTTNTIVENGMVVVCAAGNEGFLGLRTIASPASAEKAIAVGATGYMMDYIAYFSSRGPVGWDNNRMKPDVVAPGEDIYSTYPPDDYERMSGTSMATPHVSGVIALMLQANISLTPGQIKDILKGTSVDLGESGEDNTYGAGRISAWNAITNVTTLGENVTKPMLFAGTPKWYYCVNDTVDVVAISWNGTPLSGTNVTFIVTREYYDWTNSLVEEEIINKTKVTDSLGFAKVSFVPTEPDEYYITVKDDYNNTIDQWMWVSTCYYHKPPFEVVPWHYYITVVNGTVDMAFTVVTSDFKPFNDNLTLVIEGSGRYLNGTWSGGMEIVNVTLTPYNGTIRYKLNLSETSFDDELEYWYGDIYIKNESYSDWAGKLYISREPVKSSLIPGWTKALPNENVTFVFHAYNYVTNKPIPDREYTVRVYWFTEVEVKSLYEKGLLEDLIKGNKARISNFIKDFGVNYTEFNITTTNGIAIFNISVPDNVYFGVVYVKGENVWTMAWIIVDIKPWIWHRTAPEEKANLDISVNWVCENGKPSNEINVKVHLWNESGGIPNETVYLYTWEGAKAVVTDENGYAVAIFNATYNGSLPPWKNEFEVLGVWNGIWDYGYAYPPICKFKWSDIDAEVSNGILNVSVKHYLNGNLADIPSVFEVNKMISWWDYTSTLHSEYVNASEFTRRFEVDYGMYRVMDVMPDEWGWGYSIWSTSVGYSPLKLLTPIQKFYPVNSTAERKNSTSNSMRAMFTLSQQRSR